MTLGGVVGLSAVAGSNGGLKARWFLPSICLWVLLTAIFLCSSDGGTWTTHAAPAARQTSSASSFEVFQKTGEVPAEAAEAAQDAAKDNGPDGVEETKITDREDGPDGDTPPPLPGEEAASVRGEFSEAGSVHENTEAVTLKEISEQRKSTKAGGNKRTFEGENEVEGQDESNEDDGSEEQDEWEDALSTAAAEWFGGIGKYATHTMLNMLEDRFREWLSKQETETSTQACQETKLEGLIPSVANGDSPLKSFGYPQFDEESGVTVLRPRIPLSTVNGFRAPVHVGAEDYYIQGTYDQVVAFFECFDEYEVIASKLMPNGHWTKEEGHGPLYVQVQNTIEGVRSPIGSPAQILFRYGVASLRKAIRVAAALNGHLPGSYEDLLQMVDNVSALAEFLPGASTDDVIDLWSELAATADRSQQIAIVVEAIEKAIQRKRLDESAGWQDVDAVDLSAPLTVMLTSYPRPSHGVRATIALPSNKALLRDIKEQFSILFETSVVGRTLLEAANGSSRFSTGLQPKDQKRY
ncbi:hypothetical protein NCLIV_005580 [Neospora caninum Liverpool]|uniref:Uncharacterized protein n=1 Tax=Neospora caninum (strain Liverpool) TaxID=572307 RepID=F0V8P1_NEOCL|nr:hypothetical protein NCLIV_005580 [Neospora caninum Liverpool]CBZ50082.1 hypothetical protein NCLIV_005580 [Neospora caninum Liverpool]CEL64677.1 TPA: hypothetical protein BN1204_005580 [Neospora caninum Liverpool]|eukprot:XP_003880117.1 hypothetical protein NCLIV_005580 [Neospora caninum Liverpool]